MCDGLIGADGGSDGSQMGMRFEAPEKMSFADKKAMDADGIDIALLYPSQGPLLYSHPDSELLTTLCKAYNDWLAEFYGAYPECLKGIAMLGIDDIGSDIRERERCAELGLVGAMISVYPTEQKAYDRPEYDPLWAAAQDLGLPLSLHLATNRPGSGYIAERNLEIRDYAALVNVDPWGHMSPARLILIPGRDRFLTRFWPTVARKRRPKSSVAIRLAYSAWASEPRRHCVEG